jgi:hypothetical protein
MRQLSKSTPKEDSSTLDRIYPVSLLHAVLYIFTRTKALLYIVKEKESPIRRREG